MAAARVFLLLCLSLLLIQSFGRENFVRVSSENHGGAEHPDWRVCWHQHPPLPSWLPKTKWPLPHPPLPSWLPKTKWPFPHPPLPSWLPKTKHPFPHPPLPSWLPKNKWRHFPALPPLPSGCSKWPWLPHGPHHSTKTIIEDNNKAAAALLETKCPSTPAVIESCMKEQGRDTNGGYKLSTECCESVAEINDECSDELYVPAIKYQCR